MSLAPGAQVGTYTILELLGSGGMASVYRARHVVLGSIHALKVLRSDLVANAGIRQRFLDEGRVQAQLKHPGIVRVTDIVSEPGVAGLVMDLLEGTPLDVELGRGPLSVEGAATWMLQVLGAVGYAHANGIVHRDLKPSNLFIAQPEGGRRSMRVLDFGIAKVAGKARTLTSEMVGTYAYMSPEQVKDASTVDARSDIFALGAVLYEMVVGRPAFEGDTDFITMQKVSRAELPPLEHGGAPLPDALAATITRALALEPGDRFADCAAFARSLEKLVPPAVVKSLEGWKGSGAEPVLLGGAAQATWSEQDEPAPVVVEPVAEPVVEAPLVVVAEYVEPELPASPAIAVVAKPVATELARERHDLAVRASGAAQVLTGILNTFVLWMVTCWGLPWLTGGVLSALGLPGVLVWMTELTRLLACGLLIIGPMEILSGLRALLAGAAVRTTVQRTAMLQLVALAMGGIPSFFVGGAITGLLLAVRDPDSE